ncbi:hypothetical protein ASPCADRAFT_126474 [Aspergillus carbonarius ITEM 5010]|uniref:Uncharacterized protein n=1 Tax=Aspergillus carbonarius (strain ITEM 5010) TaxID=602072 RepID=A0A1R3RYN1_ASPC5|nr:hypothetical protein ASPCADRAFT_126474 [Aspergillus carbonarius ITEM 5010]
MDPGQTQGHPWKAPSPTTAYAPTSEGQELHYLPSEEIAEPEPSHGWDSTYPKRLFFDIHPFSHRRRHRSLFLYAGHALYARLRTAAKLTHGHSCIPLRPSPQRLPSSSPPIVQPLSLSISPLPIGLDTPYNNSKLVPPSSATGACNFADCPLQPSIALPAPFLILR